MGTEIIFLNDLLIGIRHMHLKKKLRKCYLIEEKNAHYKLTNTSDSANEYD